MLGATAIALGGVVCGASGWRAPALVAALAAGALGMGARLDDAARFRPLRPVVRTLEATVRETARGGSWVRVDLEEVAAAEPARWPPPARVRVLGRPTAPGSPALEDALPGERVRLRVRLRAPRALRNPGSRPTVRELARRGVGAVARLVHPALHTRLPRREGPRPLAPLHRWRALLAERLVAAGPGGGLLAALALGDRRALREQTRESFRRLGLAHLLAVSGLHLALVGALVFAAARWLAVRSRAIANRGDARAPALWLAVAVAGLYALLAGWGIPVRRAAVLLLAAALAVARGRPGQRGPPLAAAAIGVLAFEPQALFEPGAQLSFAASAALAAAAPDRTPPPRGRGARLCGGLSRILRASSGALAATAPLAALHWGQVAPLALAANLIAIPWTALALLPAALAAALAAGFPGVPLAEAVLGLCEGIARASCWGIERAASALPGAATAGRPDPLWMVPVCALGLLALRVRKTSWRAALAGGVSAVLALAPAAEFAPPPPRVVALEVGHGDAVLVQGREGSVLIDAGPAIPGGPDLGRRVVVPALAALGLRRLDLVLATHADLDHCGGLPAVLAAVPVGAVWIPIGGRESVGFAELLAAARARGVPVFERGEGSPPARVGDLRIAPLWPPPAGFEGTGNDRSLVVRIDVAGRRLLFPGDIGAAAEAELTARAPALRADLLKLPHHGSRGSGTAPLLRAVDASVAVLSAPLGTHFGMPHPELLQRARAAGLSVWWTGRDGAVLIDLGTPLAMWSLDAHASPRPLQRTPHRRRARPVPSLREVGSGAPRPPSSGRDPLQ